jgi:hypothetical protein
MIVDISLQKPFMSGKEIWVSVENNKNLIPSGKYFVGIKLFDPTSSKSYESDLQPGDIGFLDSLDTYHFLIPTWLTAGTYNIEANIWQGKDLNGWASGLIEQKVSYNFLIVSGTTVNQPGTGIPPISIPITGGVIGTPGVTNITQSGTNWWLWGIGGVALLAIGGLIVYKIKKS